MNTEYYKKYEPLFGSWEIVKLIGEGSFGKVYEMKREDFAGEYKAALKAITIPQNESEVKSLMYDGMDEASATTYFKNLVKEIVSEFVLMSKLKGNSNVVSYEDHVVIAQKEGLGWDILIRMELLTPLMEYARANTFTRKDVINLGIDMCKALEICQKSNIIHRDIKPENIFISEYGDFKLGDFGIARTIEKTSGGLSKKGTYTYMAPEVYKGEDYGSAVDIYSLGLVMYRMLNENRTPFLPAYPAPITHTDRDNALVKRMSGTQCPKPCGADGRLAEIVLKACAYSPKDRYSSPMQMRGELEAILYNKEETKGIYPKGDETPIKSIEYVQSGGQTLQVKAADKTEALVAAEEKGRKNNIAANITNEQTANGTESFSAAFEQQGASLQGKGSAIAPSESFLAGKKKEAYFSLRNGGIIKIMALSSALFLFIGMLFESQYFYGWRAEKLQDVFLLIIYWSYPVLGFALMIISMTDKKKHSKLRTTLFLVFAAAAIIYNIILPQMINEIIDSTPIWVLYIHLFTEIAFLTTGGLVRLGIIRNSKIASILAGVTGGIYAICQILVLYKGWVLPNWTFNSSYMHYVIGWLLFYIWGVMYFKDNNIPKDSAGSPLR